MKLIQLLFTCLTLLTLFVLSYEKVDYEIFELQDELRKQEGKEADLYKLLQVDRSARSSQISKAYRKLSLAVHPDKDSSQKATKRFALLGNAHKILKHKFSRKRYDHFLYNGFPVWRGTAYMYNRHRPGVLFVIIFLACLFTGTDYVIRWVNFVRTKERINNILEDYMETLSARDQRKLKEQIDRPAGQPADHDILPRDFDITLLKEPKIDDLLLLKYPVSIYRSFVGKKSDVEAKSN